MVLQQSFIRKFYKTNEKYNFLYIDMTVFKFNWIMLFIHHLGAFISIQLCTVIKLMLTWVVWGCQKFFTWV